jgi:hypothetical protein
MSDATDNATSQTEPLTFTITHWLTGEVLFSVRAETIKQAVEAANAIRANLFGANLESANLFGANLESANLFGANLESANLVRANLVRANLESANLFGANLESAKINWNSHALISEILWQAADTVEREMFAAFIRRKTEWCWKTWLEFNHPEQAWALGVLRSWVKEGDNAPAVLRESAQETTASQSGD